MTISKRILNTKRHTSGFVIGGTDYTRAQAIRLARKGEISGVRVATGPRGPYLVSSTERSLYSLPTRLAVSRTAVRAAAKRNKTSR